MKLFEITGVEADGQKPQIEFEFDYKGKRTAALYRRVKSALEKHGYQIDAFPSKRSNTRSVISLSITKDFELKRETKRFSDIISEVLGSSIICRPEFRGVLIWSEPRANIDVGLDAITVYPATNNRVPMFRSFTNIGQRLNCQTLNLVYENLFSGPALSLLKIPNLNLVTCIIKYPEWVNIINEHLKSGKDILACQEELIDNDLEEFAQL